MSGERLFQRLVEVSGLSAIVGPMILRRALAAQGVLLPDLTSSHVARLKPELERTLRIYLPADELAQAMSRIDELTGA